MDDWGQSDGTVILSQSFLVAGSKSGTRLVQVNVVVGPQLLVLFLQLRYVASGAAAYHFIRFYLAD